MKIVIFGGSGDLSKRKLFPSLSKLDSKHLHIIVYSRSDVASTYRNQLEEFHSYREEFFQKIEFVRGDYDKISLDPNEEYIFYFSVPPHVYSLILNGIREFKGGYIAIEKPFGCSIESYNAIVEFEKEHSRFKIMLIDHYLLKPQCLLLPALKRDLVIDDSVKRVDFIAKEELGVEGRLYFDATGIVRDIVQNHLLMLYGSLLSDSHESMNCERIGQKRLEILRNTNIVGNGTYGQYRGYEEEIGKISKTETYAQIFVTNNKPEFSNTIFSFQAGKGLDEKKTEIRINYKKEHYKRIIEKTLKTEKLQEMDNLSLSQLTISSNEESMVKKAHINNVTLILNLAPRNDISLVVEINNKIHEFILFDKEFITDKFKQLYGDFDDHAVIFDAMVNGKEVPLTLIEEGQHQWRIFGGVETEPGFYYEKGILELDEAEIESN